MTNRNTDRIRPTSRPAPKPPRLSVWIRAAVADAQRLGATRGFQLNMGKFNDRDRFSADCLVCLGGAAIVGRGLRKPGDGIGGISAFSAKLAFALDSVRLGELVHAAHQLGHTLTGAQVDALNVASQAMGSGGPPLNPDGSGLRWPWDVYLRAADAVEAAGL